MTIQSVGPLCLSRNNNVSDKQMVGIPKASPFLPVSCPRLGYFLYFIALSYLSLFNMTAENENPAYNIRGPPQIHRSPKTLGIIAR